MSNRSSLDWLLALAALVVIFAGLVAAKAIVTPLLLAAFFSILFAPGQAWLIKIGLPVPLAVIVTLTLVLVLFVVLVDVLTASVTSLIADLPQLTQSLDDRFQLILEHLPANDLSSGLSGLLQPETALNLLQTLLRNALGVMNNFLLVVFLIFFMLLESSGMHDKLSKIGTPGALKGFSNFSQKVNSYMIYKGIFSALTGAIIALGLWLLSIDYAVLWGFLAFLLNFIPTVGSILAAIPPLLLSLISGTVVDVGLVAILFGVVNIAIGNVVEPKYMGQGMGLSSLVVFLSLLFWGWTFGIVGMFLAVPLTMVIKIGLNTIGHNKIAALLEP